MAFPPPSFADGTGRGARYNLGDKTTFEPDSDQALAIAQALQRGQRKFAFRQRFDMLQQRIQRLFVTSRRALPVAMMSRGFAAVSMPAARRAVSGSVSGNWIK
jgi:hypothetical protein